MKDKNDLNSWILEQHTCEKCGKVMIEKYGSGRFCSKFCACSRPCSEEAKEKKRKTYFKTMAKKADPQEKIMTSKYLVGYYRGIYCNSGYELIYMLYCKEHKIKIERCNLKFKYTFKGKTRLYVPDFFLPELNRVVELKGRGMHYDEALVNAKQEAAKKSKYDYEIIFDDAFNSIYLAWAKKFYNFKDNEYSEFCKSMYENKKYVHEDRTHVSRTKNYKWINNNEVQILIPEEKLNKYISEGWFLGRLRTENMKKSWDKLRKNKPIKVKHPRGYCNTLRKGKKQIHKGEERIFVWPEEIESYLCQGWKLGTGHKQKGLHHSGGAHHFKK